jgi:molybdopterin-binding protein
MRNLMKLSARKQLKGTIIGVKKGRSPMSQRTNLSSKRAKQLTPSSKATSVMVGVD